MAIIPSQSTVDKNGFWQSDRYFKALIGLDHFLNDEKLLPHAQSTGQVVIISPRNTCENIISELKIY